MALKWDDVPPAYHQDFEKACPAGGRSPTIDAMGTKKLGRPRVNKFDIPLNEIEIRKTVKQLMEDSPLESSQAKLALAEAAAMCRIQLRAIMSRALKGKAYSEDARAISGIASTLNRLCGTLQVTTPKDDEIGF